MTGEKSWGIPTIVKLFISQRLLEQRLRLTESANINQERFEQCTVCSTSWLCFAKRRSRRLSLFPAGTLVTYQTYAGSTSPVAVTAGEGLVGVWCCGCTVFPPLSFFLYGGPTGGFRGGGSFAYGVTPCAAVSGKCRSLQMADVASTKGLFYCVFIALLWCSSVSQARSEFAIQNDPGQAMVFQALPNVVGFSTIWIPCW